MPAASQRPRRHFWRSARRVFRWCRISVWLVVLALLVFVVWINRVGLPDWAKERLVTALRAHGMDVQFTRMRLVWHRGIVAEQIQFGKPGEPRGIRASAEEADLQVGWKALLRRQFDVEGIVLRAGHLVLPVWGTNNTPQELTVGKVNGELRFLPNDQWQLNGLRAEAFGVRVMLSGTVTNASHVKQWRFGRDKPKEKTPQAFWHDLISDFQRTEFEKPTEIFGAVSGDARDLGSFRAHATITSPSIDSPWGKGRNLKLTAQIDPQPEVLIHVHLKLEAQEADTRWGRAASVNLDAQLSPSLTQWTPTNAHLYLQLRRAVTPWANASLLTIKADFRPNPADAASSLAEYSARGQQIQTKWARFAQAELTSSGVLSSSNAWPSSATVKLKFAGGDVPPGRASSGTIEAKLRLPPYESLQFTNENVSWWTRLDAIGGEISAQMADVHLPRLDAKSLSMKADWRAPALAVPEFNAVLYNGTLQGAATLDTMTRVLAADVKSSIDPHLAAHLFTSNTLSVLSQLQWQTPPTVNAQLRVTLPAWRDATNPLPARATNWAQIDWRREVLPTLALDGFFRVGPCRYRGVSADSVQSDVSYTNHTWRLPNLLLTRPEGRAHVAHLAHERTGDYQFAIDSTIDLHALRPALDPSLQEIMDDFRFASPPPLRAEISGNWSRPKETSARVALAITNVAFRERAVISCRTLVTITNQIITCHAPEVVRAEGIGRAEAVVIDIPKMLLYITNATGMLQPADITHVIHPKVEQTMAPYRFINAPQARAWGKVDLVNELGSDLWFELAGGPFEWRGWRFQQITGVVHWGGPWLTISNLAGSMHGGNLEGSMRLDFTTPSGAGLEFRALVHDINLHSLLVDLVSPTNKIEGTLGGLIVVTNANTDSLQSWFGYGNMTLVDGQIWEVPVFGFFSPILNAIIPGSGNNRARDATATFTITNGVFYSTDLRIFASGMRLKYEGTVDLEARINGRMEAQLFRDTPGIGMVVSKVLWPVTKIFEYKITGTFNKPRPEPVFIPKLLLMPFHPLRTLRELMDQGNEEPLDK